MNGLRRRIAGKAIAIAIGVPALVGSVGVHNAHAATQVTEGKAGSVTYYQTEGYAGEIISIPGSYAWRSPATSGQQTAYVRYTIYRPNLGGSWTTGWSARTIPVGAQGVWLPSYTTDVTTKMAANGAYTNFQVSMEVHWHSATTGAYLGGRGVVYNQAGDYRCLTNGVSAGCFVGGGQITFAPSY